MRILVVDDEKLLVKGVKFNLENEGYEVECAYDGASAVELARNGRFDLIILDVMMPELDGQEACMRIREFSNVPIIMLTAKSEDADKLMGFECGADDYVTKPFNILELKARVRALLRRAAGTQRNRGAVLTAGDLSLNTEERVAIRDGKTVDLTAKEYDLIELLMRNPRRVYSRENLMNVVWGYAYAGDYRTVDVHIRRLRENDEFPHEIGLFLSYPPEDVRGFIENKACRFKCAGLWKVYGDEERAKELFRQYKRCTDRCCALWRAGSGLAQLAV